MPGLLAPCTDSLGLGTGLTRARRCWSLRPAISTLAF